MLVPGPDGGWGYHPGFRRRRPIGQRAVRTFGLVMATPILNQDLRLPQVLEDLPIQQLVSQLAVEALNVAIPPRAARLDE